ncbi:DEAD/DEAH box helicase family protein [Aeribacillus sp. FSL K6-8394]
MRTKQIKKGNNLLFCNINEMEEVKNPKDVGVTWTNSFKEVLADDNNQLGLRTPQFGAICAIRSHWTVSREAATIVMPTGTGKTETMLATIVAEKSLKTLIVVPSNLLRQQIFEKAKTFGVLYKIGVLDDKFVLPPNVALLASKFDSFKEFKEFVEPANIVITTMQLANLFPDDYKKYLAEACDTLIVDEAHHIGAKTWSKFKSYFVNNRILQFTATPFRNDEKKIDGKIIYNFPLLKAQEQGYFQPIMFYPLEEFNDKKSDEMIAREAVKILEEDIKAGYEHILLVRASTKKRAEELYYSIYNKKYKRFNPVLLISDISNREKRKGFQALDDLKSRIVVCVNMFGEGIDIPNLKIAAIHDKYKSLPITLQFIGRFARTKKGLGDAKIVANIANEEVQEAIRDLYNKDSDWNQLLSIKSEGLINREVALQDLEERFKGNGIDKIGIKQIIPKVSMYAYKVKSKSWAWEKWTTVLDENICRYYINDEEKVLVVIEPKESNVGWTTQHNISNLSWELYVIYWNQNKNVAFVNATDKSLANKLVEAIFGESNRITGESIFRCLYGINHLMLATVGLNSAINGPIRYKMFAGIDIAQGLSEATKNNSYKSNLFGVGYNGNGKVSIGCSHKGTIWAKWVESIDYWMNWCNEIIDKVLDSTIDSQKILEGVLVPRVIKEIPSEIPYRIDWPLELDFFTDDNLFLERDKIKIPIYEVAIKLLEIQPKKDVLQFYVGNENFKETFELSISDNTFRIKSVSKSKTTIARSQKRTYLADFFQEYPPIIKFIDQSTLEGNLYVTLKDRYKDKSFPPNQIFTYDWEILGVNIKRESQTIEKFPDSIQYNVIKKLIETGDYSIVFDDDDAGEIADIIAIKESENDIIFEFYHCKYSHGDLPGSRVSDLYEVCGQAEKSVIWKQDTRDIVKRMRKREIQRMEKGSVSRFELGDLEKLKEIENKLRVYGSKLEINIVQPGVDHTKITSDMDRILVSTQSYLLETYGIRMNLLCS